MKIVILDALTFGETLLSGFYKLGDVDIFQTTMPEQTQDRIAHADVIVTNKVVITSEHMANTPTLKLICVAATGMNNVDLEAAKKEGCRGKKCLGLFYRLCYTTYLLYALLPSRTLQIL